MHGSEQLEFDEDDDAMTTTSSSDEADDIASTSESTEETNPNSDSFAEMCKTIRVLNALRQPNVGLPLTIDGYKALGAENVMRRLVSMRQRSLARKMSKYLLLSPDILLDTE
ncbi:hypothetical protein PINS_up012111 [Pythium insidiosum]|nr:hypothetical protein PINS_up012111 [Pythium insidiosum]